MTTIQKDGSVFSVNLEKTREYYASRSPCDCAYCRNYYSQVKDKFPVLDSFLREFGADVSRPDEILSVEMNGCIDYICVDYTVCGTIEYINEAEIEIRDELPLKIIFTNGFVSPNCQTGDYFSISVEQIKLPWALDEPLPGNGERQKKAKRIFRKLFGRI